MRPGTQPRRAGMAMATTSVLSFALTRLISHEARIFTDKNAQFLAMLGIGHAQRGDHDQARQLLEELQGLAAAGFIPATVPASIHHALSERDLARDLLELAYEQRDVRMTFLEGLCALEQPRQAPRFLALMARLGFVDSAAHGRL